MSEIEPTSGDSPFDAIKHTDERGDYWLARELMPLLGYTKWERFTEAIGRAIAAITNTGEDAGQHASLRREAVNGTVRGTTRDDYRLTRYGAYMTAMNGDPRKSAIAHAQMYFAVKAREAEVRQELDELEVARRYVKAIEEKRAALARAEDAESKLAIAQPKVDYVTGFVDAEEDTSILRVFAIQLGTTDPKLREYLKGRKVLSRRTVDKRWSNSKQRLEPVYEWLPFASYRKWFSPKDQPEAPRLHNGQMRTTLYVTPVGKVGIRRLLMKWPLDGEAA